MPDGEERGRVNSREPKNEGNYSPVLWPWLQSLPAPLLLFLPVKLLPGHPSVTSSTAPAHSLIPTTANNCTFSWTGDELIVTEVTKHKRMSWVMGRKQALSNSCSQPAATHSWWCCSNAGDVSHLSKRGHRTSPCGVTCSSEHCSKVAKTSLRFFTCKIHNFYCTNLSSLSSVTAASHKERKNWPASKNGNGDQDWYWFLFQDLLGSYGITS